MRILLDTNIIKQLGYFKSPKGQTFLKIVKFFNMDICLPSIVIDEVKGNFAKDLKQLSLSINSNKKSLSKLTDSEIIDDINIDNEINDFELWFDDQITNNEITILPYPNTSIEKLIKESYKGLKPFKEDGKGYKDYLIWETIIEHISQNLITTPYSLVTNNHTDFLDGPKGNRTLHSDLADQLQKNIPFTVYEDYEDFYSNYIESFLENIDINSINDLTQDAIHHRCSSYIEEKLLGYTAYGFEGLYFSNDVTISDISSILYHDIKVNKLSEHELLITVEGDLEALVDGYMEKHAYYSSHDEGVHEHVTIYDADHNDHVMAVEQYVTIPLEIMMIYHEEKKDFVYNGIQLPSEISHDWH